MTSTSPARRAVGILRLAAAAVLTVALVFQIVEKTINNDMIAEQYFTYFTILTTMIGIGVLAWGGLLALERQVDPVPFTVARMSVLTYAVVTAIVYNVLLRGIPDEGFVVSPWPGEIMHVWIPIVMLVDWLLSPGRPALRWTALRIVVIFPLVWLGFTLVRGAVDGWFPYPFLEPATGWVSVLAYVVGISAFIVGLASLAIAYSRLRPAPVASVESAV
ncbi:MAG: Pr6Pr family membrane protein [Rhodoglobus sp.]